MLVFSQFTSVLDILDDYCTMRGLARCRIDGDTGYAERSSQIDDFNAPGASTCGKGWAARVWRLLLRAACAVAAAAGGVFALPPQLSQRAAV